MGASSETVRAGDVLFAVAGAVAALDIAYLQLAALPQLRSCVIQGAGVVVHAEHAEQLGRVVVGCLSGRISGALLVAVVATAAFLWLGAGGRLARLWHALNQRGLAWAAPLPIVALGSLPYLAPGDVMLRDASLFQALSAHLLEVLRSGESTRWSAFWYLGCSPYAYYGWLYWLVSAAAGALVGLNLANKLLFFVLQLGSATAAYGFGRAVSGDSRVGAVAALAYGLSFDHLARVFSGRIQLSLLFLLVPLLFWVWELRLRGELRAQAAIAWVSVLACLLVFTHQVDGAFAVIDFALYALLRAIDRKDALRALSELVPAAVLCAVLSSFWTIPMAVEIAEVSASSKAAVVLGVHLPDPDVIWAFLPGPFADRNLHYLGLGLVVLALVGLRADFRAKRRALLGLCVLMFVASVVQSPRHAPVLLVGLSAAAGLGVQRVVSLVSSRVLVAVLALVSLDFLGMTAQFGYPDFSYLRRFTSTIEAGDGDRVLDLPTDRRVFWPSFVYLFGKHETVFGPLIEIAPPGLSIWTSIMQRAAEEHYDRPRPFGQRTLDGFYLLGVRAVVLHGEQVGGDPTEIFDNKRGGFGLERGLSTLRLDDHSVLVAAPRRVRVPAPLLLKRDAYELKAPYERREIPYAEIGELIGRMGLDRGAAQADAIPVLDADDASLDGPVSLRVENVKTEPNRVTIAYQSTPAFLQLAYSYGRHLSVSIDGVEVPFQRTAFDTMAVKTPGGAHRLTIEGRPTRLQGVMRITSVLGLILVVALLFWRRRRGGGTGRVTLGA